MLSGLKFISRDKLDATEQDSDCDSSQKERKKTSRKGKDKGKKKNDCCYSSDSEEIEELSKGSKRRKKWYSSNASSSSSSQSESDSDCSGERKDTRERKQRKEKRTKHGTPNDKARKRSKERSKSRKDAFLSYSLSENNSESDDGHHFGRKDEQQKRSKREKEKSKKRKDRKGMDKKKISDDGGDFVPQDNKGLARKEMGLEWMLKPMNQPVTMSTQSEDPPEEPKLDEGKKPNPKELNPYLRDNGSSYPDDDSQTKVDAGLLPTHLVVGDGGTSWRLKALKRAQEQAAREGRKLDEVVAERWGSLGNLAVSAASRSAAHAHAHLHAIRDRKRGLSEIQEGSSADQSENTIRKVGGNKLYLQDSSVRLPEMREPKFHDSLTWRKRKASKMSAEDTQLVSSAAKHLNKYADDGSFFNEFKQRQNNDASGARSPINATCEGNEDMDMGLNASKVGNSSQGGSVIKPVMTTNQLAAKVLQLRMKGKNEEAEKLLRETEVTAREQESRAKTVNDRIEGNISRFAGRISSSRQKKVDEDADVHLARTIMKNKQYSISGQADDEYDFDGTPSKKQSRKRERISENKSTEKNTIVKRLLTQQERCQFCFENPSRPKHLVISIANFTYLVLPQWQPIVPGHCYILPMQHESATRTVDNNVWEEIRNFKKCLIMMFAKQEKDVIFLETVMGLAKQRRHCLVECIPLPQEIAKEAPLYFKKAIDEAEDEWSQHNAKKLIDTSEKGLRASIPKDFPYFYVEFGLNKGFVHVIDDERQFKSNLGLNVIRGMLRLPEEDMYRRQKHESVEMQKQAVAMFAQEWEPFDWTKQLD